MLAGLLFGLGLAVSQMIDPAKVTGFLDVAGDWDPSLIFVMGGAVIVAAIGFAAGRRLQAPLCAPAFSPPVVARVDFRLVAGALVFGTGWGLVGFCPGPALAALGVGGARAAIFVLALLAGMGGFSLVDHRFRPR